ncbi:intermembrane phospholipid transport protein YdbH family protein [Sphingomonas jaspsi]|uniref:intermembrane phospholipid transport protein YdbH family protein n=1 Tax=Sphingomonas jaspsi TaxID=392409 RepID=UPI0004B84292|nr:YdbH domain-containing protein [Sphingomonas jaspsi]
MQRLFMSLVERLSTRRVNQPMVAWRNEDGGRLSASPPEAARTRASRTARVVGWVFVALLAVILAAATVAWLSRKPIANRILADEMAKRGVRATYTLDRVGLRTQEISNLVIGDPAHPDLTVRKAVVQIRIKVDGSVQVYRVAARGVRLNAAVVGRKVTFGDIDKLLPPPSGKPFTLPNLSVDLKDSTIALRSPYGPVGFALEGRGNLSGGFKGRLAASAPALRMGACSIDVVRAYVAIGVTARRPDVKGPVAAQRFACPSSRLAFVQPRVELDANFAEAFDQVKGKARMSLAAATAGDNGLSGVISNLTFAGRPPDLAGGVDLAAQQARLGDVLSQRTRLDGRYRLDATKGRLALVSDYRVERVAIRSGLVATITDPLRSIGGTPLTPILRAIAVGVDRAARSVDASGSLRLVNGRGGGGVRIERADATTTSGASIRVSGGDGITYYWPDSRLRIDGMVETRGGGLPTAGVRLSQSRSGAPLNGTADIAPYSAGSARLALAPVRFAGRRDGWTDVSTVAVVDGPFDGGRITGLRLPIQGRFGRGGALRFGEGCIDARFTSLQAGSLRLGPSRVPLCATDGAIVRKGAGGQLAVSLASRGPVALRGRLGNSPFALDATRARFAIGSGFLIDRAKVRMGKPDAPVLINAASVSGRFAGSGTNGRFSGADALIGKVPLKVSDASGNWRVHNGDLDIDGGLTLSDAADPPKFYPLRSDNVRFSLANSKIHATGGLKHPYSGALVSNVVIDHNLRSGDGSARLDVPGINFGKGLQPEELTRLTEGVVALVVGTVSGQGHIAWNGDGKVVSTGDFTTGNLNFAAPFGPVTGMKGTIHFSDLLGLTTDPGQTLTLESVNPGILVEDGVVRYQLLPENLVKIERGEWPFMGGRLILQETILNFGRDAPKRLTFEVVGLDAKQFVDSMGFKEIQATGIFDGVLPMIFDDEGGRIVGGRLDSREDGGTLSYNGVVNRANLGMFGGLAFDALRDLRFKSMIIRLDGYLDGEFATRLTIDQVGLGNTSTQRFLKSVNKIPFKFNVSIKGPFRALIATAKSFNDATDVISPALPRPLDEVPGIVVETRRREESQQQTQTPVDQKVDVSTKPKPNP